MVKHLLIPIDDYNQAEPGKGILEFLMQDDGTPVEGSLQNVTYNIDARMQKRIHDWATHHTDRYKYKNIEVKIVSGMVWFVTDSYRCFPRRDVFDKIYKGSKLAVS